jgi:putative ABC transport system permease protein
LALAAVTGLAFGLAPALQASRVSLNEVLKEAGRNAAESRSGMLFRSLLLVSETALAMVLLVGASLLFRSFLRTRGIDPGFKSEHTLSLTIDLTLSRYPTRKDQARFFEQVIERIKNLAGVQLVGGSNCPPLLGRSGTVDDLAIEGRREKIPIVSVASITPDYFRAMGIPLKQGRYFGDGDRDGSPRVAIVSESFARRLPGPKGRGMDSTELLVDHRGRSGRRSGFSRKRSQCGDLCSLPAGWRTFHDLVRTHGGKANALGGVCAQAGCKS